MRTNREVALLWEMRQRHVPCSVRLLRSVISSSQKDLYLIFEYQPSDLNEVIKAKALTENVHKQYITYQLLLVLSYLHKAHVVHRDLKPANILINSECKIKLADFGLARSIVPAAKPGLASRWFGSSEKHGNNSKSGPVTTASGTPIRRRMTDYIATRWWRAPEVLLGSQAYSTSVDMWAVGCIIAEMYIGKPIFRGTSNMHQMQLLLGCFGRPTDSALENMRCNYTTTLLNEISPADPRGIDERMEAAQAPQEAIHLAKALLDLDPSKRLTAEQAIKHPFCSMFFNPEYYERVLKGANPICLRPDCSEGKHSVEESKKQLLSLIEQHGLHNAINGGVDVNMSHSANSSVTTSNRKGSSMSTATSNNYGLPSRTGG
mmetsp:Transcript_9554/g.35026  ORF Transcript_9554/g.35026 Transcript_9554/m.35026 type:complete len:376 (-) Transcript_9554:233-1360(-)